MKKTLFIIAMFFGFVFLSPAQEKAQTKKDNRYLNTVKFSTLSFVNSTFQLSYERFLKQDKSLEFFVGYTYCDNWEDRREGFNAEIQYKYFVFKSEGRKTTKKLYFAPYASFHYIDLVNDNYWNDLENYPYGYYTTEHFIINSFRGGVLFGFNWILADRITIDAYMGGGIRKTNNFSKGRDTYYDSDIWEPGYNGIAPKIGIDVGINF